MNKNTNLIIGKNKTGKTRKVLFNEINNKINNNENLLILDSRLEYYNNYAKRLEENGYNIKVVNFEDPSKSNGWNPLAYISHLYNNDMIDKAIEMLKDMGNNIFRRDSKNVDPFWTDMATNYFIGLSLILLKISKESHDAAASEFYALLEIMNEGEEKYSDVTYLKQYCSKLDSTDPIYVTLSSIINAPTATRGSIISVFKQKINNYFMRPQLVKSFHNNYFHIEQLKDNTEKTAIFVVGYKPVNDLTNVLINQCIDCLYTNKRKFNIILDGFNNLPIFDNIDDIIDIANHGDINLYLTATNKDELVEKYNNYKFSNIEEVIELSEVYDEDILEENYPLPNLEKHELTKFDFKKYVS